MRKGVKGHNTAKAKATFIKAFAECGVLTHAAKKAGITLTCYRNWLAKDQEFADNIEDARQEFIDTMAMECRRRSVDGVREKVFFQGVECGYQQRYSDNLLMFMLKAADPAKYRDNHKSEDERELDKAIAARLAELVVPSKGDSAG